ncbi:hypothetical protein BASA60_007696 [Batrachochytrium salamandrivorans]|nr:hypothetical protein BASA60_007696 [Batrachochytrium salamandrivorans]
MSKKTVSLTRTALWQGIDPPAQSKEGHTFSVGLAVLKEMVILLTMIAAGVISASVVMDLLVGSACCQIITQSDSSPQQISDDQSQLDLDALISRSLHKALAVHSYRPEPLPILHDHLPPPLKSVLQQQ